jgi:hypothetical protein
VFAPRAATIFLLLILLLGAVTQAGIDSGGGRSPLGTGSNHCSIGAPVQTTQQFGGLIDILYPSAPALDPEDDTDGNGLPDSWEEQYFDVIGVVPSADADDDGSSNMMEYLAGTHPRSASSVFRPATQVSSGKMILSVPTVVGREYRVWGTSNLLSGWGDAPVDTIRGDGSTVLWEYLMSQSPTGRYFLRIEVRIPPKN